MAAWLFPFFVERWQCAKENIDLAKEDKRSCEMEGVPGIDYKYIN